MRLRSGISCISALVFLAVGGCAESSETDSESAPIRDPWVKQLVSLSADKKPPDPAPESFGMNAETGEFVHPLATRDSHDPHPFDGTLPRWDDRSYAHNMTVEAYYPITVEPFHTWQNMVDFDGRRYLYQYVRQDLKIFDITDPKNIELLLTRGHSWGAEGAGEAVNPYPADDMFGRCVDPVERDARCHM